MKLKRVIRLSILLALCWGLGVVCLLMGERALYAAEVEQLETGMRVDAKITEQVRKRYLDNKHVFDDFLRSRSNLAAVRKAVASIYAQGGKQTPSILKNLLRESKERGLSAEHAQLMAEVRNHWLFQAAKDVCRELKIDIGLLDSGTEGSVANDVDKTLRILKQHSNAVTESGVMRLIEKRISEIIADQTKIQGVDVASLDIELFSAKNIYSSAMEAKAPAVYKRELTGALLANMKNKAAYVTDGAQNLQLIWRSLGKQRALDAGHLRSGAAFTRLSYQPRSDEVLVDTPKNWLDLIELSGEVQPHHAHSSALGNHLMLMETKTKPFEKVKDDLAKYLMRIVLDTKTALTQEMIDRQKRFELDDFKTSEARNKLLQELTGLTLDKSNEEKQRLKQYAAALDIADDLLRNKKLRAAGQMDRVKPDRIIFEKAARDLAGSAEKFVRDPGKWVGMAKYNFVKAAERLSAHILTHTFPDAVQTWLGPDPELVAKAKRYDARFKNQNIRILTMQMLRAAREGLGPDRWKQLVDKASIEHRQDLENLDRMLGWGRVGQQPTLHGSTDPGVRKQIYQEKVQEGTVMQRALHGLWKKIPPDANNAGLFRVNSRDVWKWALKQTENSFDLAQGLRNRVDLEQVSSQLKAEFGSFVRYEIIDHLGNVDALMTVVRAWQDSERIADPEVRVEILKEVFWNELISRIPYAGTTRGLYQAMEGGDLAQFSELAIPVLERLGASIAGLPSFAAPLILYMNLSKQFVGIIGHEMFQPLRSDYMDLIFKGYMESSEAALLRAGRNIPEGYKPSVYPSIVSRVPVHFVVLQGEILQRLLDDETIPDKTYLAMAKEVEQSGDQQVVSVDLKTPYARKIKELRRRIHDLDPRGTLDSSTQYREELVKVLTEVLRVWERQAVLAEFIKERMRTDLRLSFEVHRQNAYRYFQKQVQEQFTLRTGRFTSIDDLYEESYKAMDRLRRERWNLRGSSLAEVRNLRARQEAEDQELKQELQWLREDESKAAHKVFRHYVDDWLQAAGDFADADQNLALGFAWHDEQTKEGIAQRLVMAYLNSRNGTIAAEGALDLLSQMDRVAEEQALEAQNRRLAILYDRTLSIPLDPGALIQALAPDPEEKPKAHLKAIIVHSLDESGEERQVLQVEATVTAIPGGVDDMWQARSPPRIRPVGVRTVPAEVIRAIGVSPKQVKQAYEISLEVARQGSNRPFVTGRTWAVAALMTDTGQAAPPPETARERDEGHWLLEKIVLVQQPQGYPITKNERDDKHTAKLEVSSDGGVLRITGSVEGTRKVKDCPNRPDQSVWKETWVRKHFLMGLFTPSIPHHVPFPHSNPFTGSTVGYERYSQPTFWTYTISDSKSTPAYRGKCKPDGGMSAGPVGIEPDIVNEVVTPLVGRASRQAPREELHVGGVRIRARQEAKLIKVDKVPDKEKASIPPQLGAPALPRVSERPWTDEHGTTHYPHHQVRSYVLKYEFSDLLAQAYSRAWIQSGKRPKKVTVRLSVNAYAMYSLKNQKYVFDLVYGLQGQRLTAATPVIEGFNDAHANSELTSQNAGNASSDTAANTGVPNNRGEVGTQATSHSARHMQESGATHSTTVPQASAQAGTGARDHYSRLQNQARTGLTAASVLSSPRPWQHPGVQQAIDDWLQRAKPRQAAAPGADLRYDAWGRITGRTSSAIITATPPPEHGNKGRYAYLWERASTLHSLNLCTLHAYVERRLQGEPATDCNVPAPMGVRPGTTGMASKNLRLLQNIPASDWINGKPDLRDKVVLVMFYAPWDVASLRGAGEADRQFRRYSEFRGRQAGGMNLQYLAISQDSRQSVEKSLKRSGITFPVGLDKSGKIRQGYGAVIASQVYLLDTNGNVIMRMANYPYDHRENEILHRKIDDAMRRK